MTDKLKRLPLLLLTAYFTKVLILSSPSWVDAGVLLVLGLMAGFYEAWSQLDFLKSIEAQIKTLNEKTAALDRADNEVKTYMTSLKLGQQIRYGSK